MLVGQFRLNPSSPSPWGALAWTWTLAFHPAFLLYGLHRGLYRACGLR